MPPPIETPKNVSFLTNRAAYIDQVLPDIKAFLSRFGGDFLYYKVWPSTDEAILLQSAEQEEQATSIDVVEQARNKEYCSREQQALARRVSGIAGEEDNGVAAPVLAQFPKASSAYGMIALQKALYNYLMAVAKAEPLMAARRHQHLERQLWVRCLHGDRRIHGTQERRHEA